VLAGVSGKAATARRALATALGIRRLWWVAAAVAGAAALFLCALREARAIPVQSDGASMVLQAWAMLHGNPLLHGWYLADVSYYTTELPEYLLVEVFRGMRSDVVQICAALTYTLLVVLAAVVARGRARGRTGLAAAAIAVAIMLGPSLAAATLLFSNPDHTGTAVPVLVALALMDWGGRRWWVPAGVAAVLAWALVGDPLVLLVGVAPLLLVGGTRCVQLLGQRRVPLSQAWYELSLVVAALAALAAGSAVRHLLRSSGGYLVAKGTTEFVQSAAMPKNTWGTLENFLGLFSANFFGERFGAALVVTGIHLAAAGLVAVAVIIALRRFFHGGDLVVALLATAITVDVTAYALVYQVSVATIREMAPVFALGAALAGRVLAEPVTRGRPEILLVFGAAAALLALAPPVLLGKPAKPAGAELAAWLVRHHLRDGIAGYWQANSVTLDSGGRVTMRAVRNYPKPGLAAYRWELDRALLDSRTHDVNFLVATAPRSYAGSTVTEQEGIVKFGKPYRVYRFQRYVILVWRKNLLPELTR
jgi:hypothetical protein